MLNGKNVLITGANGGMGKAMVKAFAVNGANIWANILDQDDDFIAYTETVSREYNVQIQSVVFDLTNFEAVKKAVMDIRATKRPIDVLINNAGILTESLLQMTTLENARRLFEVNFFAPFYLTQLVSKLMVRQPNGASIINISSVAAFDGVEGQTVYGATKAAIASMTKSLAKELGKYNVRANCIAPGVTKTPLIAGMNETVLKADEEKTYLNRLGLPQDIADTAVFLASNAARYITGQVIRVDGGRN